MGERLLPFYRNISAPCQRACPAGNDIVRFCFALENGEWDLAWQILRETNPLSAVCGRVCYHPCEEACNRGRFDWPVRIQHLERLISDFGRERGLPPPGREKASEQKVAVVGSGPSGLTCGYFLAQRGFQVTVFERHQEPGGMLREAIPTYRLPKEVLDYEIGWIQAAGVSLELGVTVDGNFFRQLKKDFDAVYVATGAHLSRRLPLASGASSQPRSGLEVLRRLAFGEEANLAGRVVVIGGGNTAVDVARAARRLGVHPIILYRRTAKEMPAHPDEVKQASEEGVEFIFCAAPTRVEQQQGSIILLCERMKMGPPGEDGRRVALPVNDGGFTLEADAIISAIGEEPELSFLEGQTVTERGKVFFGGDAVADAEALGTVVGAIGAGKSAAMAIESYLRESPSVPHPSPGPRVQSPKPKAHSPEPPNPEPSTLNSLTAVVEGEVAGLESLNLRDFEPQSRARLPMLTPAERLGNFAEVVLSLEREVGELEASRCFNCGVCVACDWCFLHCTKGALVKLGLPWSAKDNLPCYEVVTELCDGCGACAMACPRAALVMQAGLGG